MKKKVKQGIIKVSKRNYGIVLFVVADIQTKNL
jgi:hypothetical protein